METLIVGCTGYCTLEALKIAFPLDNVVVCDNNRDKHKEGNIRWFNEEVMEENFERLFMTYGFERVLFLSNYVNKDSYEVGEIEQLRRVLSLCQKSHVKQFIYVSSVEALLDIDNSDSIIYKSIENLCKYYAENYLISTKIIYSPFLISGSYKNDYWCRIFAMLDKQKKVEIKANSDEIADFMSVDDLALFLSRLFDDWRDYEEYESNVPYETIYLTSGAKTTYAEVYEGIKTEFPKARISFTGSGMVGRYDYGIDRAREYYGWFAKSDACSEIVDYIRQYKENFYIKPTLTERLREKIKLNSSFMMTIELILGTLLVELYNQYSNGSVQFRMIDVRLLFVVLMASIYGTNIGMITAFVEIVSLVAAYYRQGTNGILLFYDPGNWIPFILLMVAAAVCGYLKQKKDEDLTFIREENTILKNEHEFIEKLYEEAMEYKNQYKQDLIGSRDGFGRIFDVVQKLSTTVPEEIFAESIPVMEDVLNNKTIAIYTINDNNTRFARLNVASEQISAKLKKSINLEDYGPVLDKIKEGEIWFNNDVREGFPTYVAGIKSEGHIRVLIMIYQVEYIQISTYYANLIRILSGLMENFIIKAWEYQSAMASKMFIDGTSILKTEYFKQQLDIQKDMADNKLTEFRLFRIRREGRSLMDLDAALLPKIRNNDVLGLGSDDNIYLLASQVDHTSEGIVLKRFRDMGFDCDIVESME